MIQYIVYMSLAQWSPTGLPVDMYPIAQIESSFGKNVNHRQSDKGPDWTAVGALGIKPITAFESLKRTGYDGTQNEVTERLKNDRLFYNHACVTHWRYLRNSLPDLKSAVYAWRWGFRAAQEASAIKIAFDPYVVLYFELRMVFKVNGN